MRPMCIRALSFLIGWYLYSQPSIVLQNANPAQAQVQAGATVVINVVLTGSAGANVAALEYSVSIPTGFVFTAATGGESTAAGKQVQCNVITASTKQLCVVSGMNQTLFADGVVGTITTTVPVEQSSSTAIFNVADTIASDPTGTAVVVAAGNPFGLPVFVPPPISPCDLNGNGVTDITDVTIAINQALGLVSGTSADIDNDSVVNIVDVQRIIDAALGGSCRTGA